MLLPPHTDDPLVLRGVAALVWLLLEEPLSEDALVAGLAEGFERDSEEVARELRVFAADLEGWGALHLDGDRQAGSTEVEVSL